MDRMIGGGCPDWFEDPLRDWKWTSKPEVPSFLWDMNYSYRNYPYVTYQSHIQLVKHLLLLTLQDLISLKLRYGMSS